MKTLKAIQKLKDILGRLENSQVVDINTEVGTFGSVTKCQMCKYNDDCGSGESSRACHGLTIRTGFIPRNTNESI